MTDILLGQSYYLKFDPKLWKAMQPYPPLGTLYAASYLRSKGYQVALFDAMLAESESEWDMALDYHRPRYAIIYEDNFNYLSKMCLLRMRKAAIKMIDMARQRGCTVIIAGSDGSDHPEKYLARGAHFVIIGEGEITLGELLDALSSRSSNRLDQIQGLSFQDESLKISEAVPQSGVLQRDQQSYLDPLTINVVATPRRPDIRDLDSLPLPAWDLVDVERYRQIWLDRHGFFSMNMATTRGCPFHCNWCAKPIWGQRYNVRSPENVVAELKWLKQAFEPDHIWFVDDIFGLKPGWIPRLAAEIEQQGATIPFKCLNRVDLLLREGEIDALKRAGCQIVWVGSESGSQKILDAMEKGTRVDQIYSAARRLQEAGIQVGFFLQFGYAGETRADIEKTLQMVRDCRPDDIGMSVSYPLPGTKFYAAVKEQLGSKQNWVDSNDLAMLYRGPFSTDFYRQLHIVLHKEFRLRKAGRWLVEKLLPESESVTLKLDQHNDLLHAIKTLIKNAVTLPFARWKLERLALFPPEGLIAVNPGMTPEDAAIPSLQPGDEEVY